MTNSIEYYRTLGWTEPGPRCWECGDTGFVYPDPKGEWYRYITYSGAGKAASLTIALRAASVGMGLIHFGTPE